LFFFSVSVVSIKRKQGRKSWRHLKRVKIGLYCIFFPCRRLRAHLQNPATKCGLPIGYSIPLTNREVAFRQLHLSHCQNSIASFIPSNWKKSCQKLDTNSFVLYKESFRSPSSKTRCYWKLCCRSQDLFPLESSWNMATLII
jgi:hypothetical protein